MSIDEIAAELGLSVPDAVVALEERGHCRSVDGLRLTNEERQARLRVIRADRLARQGEPELSLAQVAREVIASQRIEGIDARRWLL